MSQNDLDNLGRAAASRCPQAAGQAGLWSHHFVQLRRDPSPVPQPARAIC